MTQNSKSMKFETLGQNERKLLLIALDFHYDNLECQSCKEKVNYKSCCIMPPVDTKKEATILCNSHLCIEWYLTEIEY